MLWSISLAVLMLWSALGRGFVLSYDMVWVPDLALGADALGLASGLPRAVPSDAVVAVLDEIVPGELLQKLVLLGALVGAGLGANRLLTGLPLAGRLAAVSVYQWNPFVVERLHIGHWPVLVAYAALPWIVVGAARWRRSGRIPPWLCVVLPIASLSASSGLVTAITLTAMAATRGPVQLLRIASLVMAANAPWLVSGLLHAGTATTASSGARAFALAEEGSLPAPLAALTLGGIWNSEVVPDTRAGLLGWIATAVLGALAVGGARAWWRSTERRDAVALVVIALIGYVLAVATWIAPEASGWFFGTVPGAGLFRDGARALALCAPLLCVLVAHGVESALRVLAPEAAARLVFAPVLVAAPIVLLPDGVHAGGLTAVEYPQSYVDARAAIAHAPGAVLSLPLTSYRQPEWNDGRKVLDPVWRYLSHDYVASDVLVVGGTTIAGEDPRVDRVRAALERRNPDERARALAAEGIGIVVTDRTAAGDAPPQVAGDVLLETDLLVLELDSPDEPDRPRSWLLAMVAAWAAFLGCGAVGFGLAIVRAASRRRQRDPRRSGR